MWVKHAFDSRCIHIAELCDSKRILHDTLLPKLIRGEIRVKDTKRFLRERGL